MPFNLIALTNWWVPTPILVAMIYADSRWDLQDCIYCTESKCAGTNICEFQLYIVHVYFPE